MGSLRFGVLGPLEVTLDGEVVELGGPRPRMLLAVLLTAGGHEVAMQRIVGALWGAEPPATALGTVHAHLARLRRALEPDRPPRAPAGVLVRVGAGYAVRRAPDALDADRFTDLARQGHDLLAGRRYLPAAATLDTALTLWRGGAYADFPDAPFAIPAASHLQELRVLARLDRLAAEVGLGRHMSAIADLAGFCREHPHLERVWELLAVAFYRAGRQVDALDTVRRARSTLAERFGVDAGPAMRRLELAVLGHDPALTAAALPDWSIEDRPAAGWTDQPTGRATVQSTGRATYRSTGRATYQSTANRADRPTGRRTHQRTANRTDGHTEGGTDKAAEARTEWASEVGAGLDDRDAARRLAVRADAALRGPDTDIWLRRLDAAQDDLRAAMRGAIADGDGAAAVDIAGGIAWQWFHQGATAEGGAWLAAGLAAPGQDRSAAGWAARGRAQVGLSALRVIVGDAAGAIAHARTAVAAAERSGDDYVRAHALSALSFAAAASGDVPYATETAGLAYRSADRGGWPELRAQARTMLAGARYSRGDLTGAAELYAGAGAEARACGYEWVGATSGWLGVEVALDQGRHEEALAATLPLHHGAGAAALTSAWLISGVSLAHALALTGHGEDGALLLGAMTGLGQRVGTAVQDIARPTPLGPRGAAPMIEHPAAYVRGLAMTHAEAAALVDALSYW